MPSPLEACTHISLGVQQLPQACALMENRDPARQPVSLKEYTTLGLWTPQHRAYALCLPYLVLDKLSRYRSGSRPRHTSCPVRSLPLTAQP